MFQITDNKVFKDSVHGYISVPKCFVKNIIDTEIFQRLRNIDQTGMRILYPDAKHDRFGHSLGVYHLGCKAVDALLDNFSKDAYWAIQSDNKSELFWAKNKLLFILACLLHDIGHTPFSHSLENDVIDNSISGTDVHQFKRELADLIYKTECDNTEKIDVSLISAAAHELLGARYILEHLKPNITAIYDELIEHEYPHVENNGLLFAENYDGKVILSKETLDQDICFIVRMILGLKYIEYKPEKQIRNCFIELLNSSNFDVDKLDYILRDTQMSGISNINVDVERLLSSINIVTKTVFLNKANFSYKVNNGKIYELSTCKFDIDENDNIFEVNKWNDSIAKHSICLNGNFKGTIKLYTNTYVRIRQKSYFESLEGEYGKSKLLLYEPVIQFGKNTEAISDDTPCKEIAGVVSVTYGNAEPHNYFMKNAYVEGPDLRFKVVDRIIYLHLNGDCNIEITGSCVIKGVLSTRGEADFCGKFNCIKFIGNHLHKSLPDENDYNEFSVGYNKQAMNILENVLDARNYLYLWVYAHHKVVYYANYLIPILSRNAFKKERRKKLPWKLEYEYLEKLDDYYVWTEIKRHSLVDKDNELYNELFSRKYKYSVYKSLSEFELVFRNFSDKQKMDIQAYFVNGISNDRFCLNDSSNMKIGGYLKPEIISKLKEEAKRYGLTRIQDLKDLVYVKATYIAKPINPHNTFIIMVNEIVVMEEIPLLNNREMLTSQNTAYYFYLYYTIESKNERVISSTTEELKLLLQLFFSSKFARNDKHLGMESEL